MVAIKVSEFGEGTLVVSGDDNERILWLEQSPAGGWVLCDESGWEVPVEPTDKVEDLAVDWLDSVTNLEPGFIRRRLRRGGVFPANFSSCKFCESEILNGVVEFREPRDIGRARSEHAEDCEYLEWVSKMRIRRV